MRSRATAGGSPHALSFSDGSLSRAVRDRCPGGRAGKTAKGITLYTFDKDSAGKSAWRRSGAGHTIKPGFPDFVDQRPSA
jgi:predicted lipoprotein with Yx(FWY)xxD motif